MSSADDPSHSRPPSAWTVAVAGMVALAVAMGIGRFAFTPLLPMMLSDGVIDLQQGSWLATANYIGYLVGALLCTLQPWIWRRLGIHVQIRPAAMVRWGMVATVLLTLGMALPVPALWPALRFAAGVASAMVFVFTAGWCLARLAELMRPERGGAIYVGPGAGIVASGLLASAMVWAHWRAAGGWLLFAVLALVLTGLVWRVFRDPPQTAAGAGAAPMPAHLALDGELLLLSLAYGMAGLGYIITATFLPVIARFALPNSHWLDLFWPLFGTGVMTGALLSTRIRVTLDMRLLLAACFFVQAIAVGLPLLWPNLAGFALGSLLLGLPFTAITYFAMQEARRLRPHAVPATVGLLTVLYGAGQIAGPIIASATLRAASSPRAGFDAALEIAAGSLILGLAVFVWMARRHPMAHRAEK